jgi:hypothetical protein
MQKKGWWSGLRCRPWDQIPVPQTTSPPKTQKNPNNQRGSVFMNGISVLTKEAWCWGCSSVVEHRLSILQGPGSHSWHKKSSHEPPCPFYPVRTQKEDTTIFKAENRPSPGTQNCFFVFVLQGIEIRASGILGNRYGILLMQDFPASRTVVNAFLMFVTYPMWSIFFIAPDQTEMLPCFIHLPFYRF